MLRKGFFFNIEKVLLTASCVMFLGACGDFDDESVEDIKASSLTPGVEVYGTVWGTEFTPNIGYLTFTDNDRFQGVDVNLVFKEATSVDSVSCGDGAMDETPSSDTSDLTAHTLTLKRLSFDKVWWRRYVRRYYGPVNDFTFNAQDATGADEGTIDYYDDLDGYSDTWFDEVDPVNHLISGYFFSESFLDENGDELEKSEVIEGDFSIPYCDFTVNYP